MDVLGLGFSIGELVGLDLAGVVLAGVGLADIDLADIGCMGWNDAI
jgi:hypothetical protein